MEELKVLFEDEHIIAVVKPYGMLSQGNEQKESMVDHIAEYLRSKGEDPTVYVVHRLDKTTGGVMVFAKTKEASAKMSELVANRKLKKVYFAVLCGTPERRSGALADLLYHDKAKNKTYVVKRERKGVKVAKLCFVVHSSAVYKGETVTKVEVLLETGRTHQIRVQFSSRKLPLVGDRKYGALVADSKIALWSHQISFCHPITGEFVKVSADTDEGAFSVF